MLATVITYIICSALQHKMKEVIHVTPQIRKYVKVLKDWIVKILSDDETGKTHSDLIQSQKDLENSQYLVTAVRKVLSTTRHAKQQGDTEIIELKACVKELVFQNNLFKIALAKK
jgi:hypothetical protein